MQDELAVGIDHGNAGRGLVDVAAYVPSAKANYVSAVNALCVMDFPLLAQLCPKKMQALLPSPEQLMLPIHRIRGDAASQRLSISDAMVPSIKPLFAENLVGEDSTSGGPVVVSATTSLSTTFVEASSVSPIPVSDYKVVDTEAQARTSSSHKIIFEEETLETSPENPATQSSRSLDLVQDPIHSQLVDLEEFCEKHYEKLLLIMADKYEHEQRKKEKLEEVKARLDFGDVRKRTTKTQESEYSESRTRSPRHDQKNKARRENNIFERLGSRGWSVSIYSDSHQENSWYTEKHSESEDSRGGHWKSKSQNQKPSIEDDDLSNPW
ncbi:hypothetical protein Tco_1140395, partial [Tanacetum coccineum]